MATTKELIVAFLTETSEATAYDVYEGLGSVSSDTVDRNLKEMTDAGTLVREKKSTNGGRPVFHYKLAVSPRETISTQATKVVDEPAQPAGPTHIFVVRKNDIPNHIWGQRQYVFARVLEPFVKRRTTRTFNRFGNAVISIFLTESSPEEIVAALNAQLPEVTCTVTTNLQDALAAYDVYTPNAQLEHGRITDWSNHFFSMFDSTSVYNQASAQPAAPQRTPMEILASGDVYALTNSVLMEALKVLAQDYITRTTATV